MTQFLVKWTPFRWACAEHGLRQGTLNIGNRQQNRLALLASAIANANSTQTWAKWRVGEQSRTSSCGLLINVKATPGYTAPAGTPGSSGGGGSTFYLTTDAGVLLTSDAGVQLTSQ
jgi:hypothetical protein